LRSERKCLTVSLCVSAEEEVRREERKLRKEVWKIQKGVGSNEIEKGTC